MDPRNNNPFDTDDTREFRSEYAANRALSETALDFDERNYTDGAYWAEKEAAEFELANIEAEAEINDMRLNGYE